MAALTERRLLTFVETTVFTKRIVALGLEESLRSLQLTAEQKKQLRSVVQQIKVANKESMA